MLIISIFLFINQLPPTTWQPNIFCLKKHRKVTKLFWHSGHTSLIFQGVGKDSP
jgi:hypothetical protein